MSACVVVLRWKDKTNSQVSSSAKREGVICLIAVALSGFAAGLLFRYEASLYFLIVTIVVAVGASLALLFRQVTVIFRFINCLLIGVLQLSKLFC